jgi:hypothetical protein
VTPVDSAFFYGLPLGDRVVRALDRVRDVHGIRQLSVDEKGRTIRVEYDASRLTRNDVGALLRAAGNDVRKAPGTPL